MRALGLAFRNLMQVHPDDLSIGQRAACLAFAAAFTKVAFLVINMVCSDPRRVYVKGFYQRAPSICKLLGASVHRRHFSN
jgi:hypothetical protein